MINRQQHPSQFQFRFRFSGALLTTIGLAVGFASAVGIAACGSDDPEDPNAGSSGSSGFSGDGGDNDGGVIFSFDPSTSNYQPVYSFAKPTGHEPHGRLTLDPNGTTLYGMTRKGGSSGFGVVFSFAALLLGGQFLLTGLIAEMIVARKWLDNDVYSVAERTDGR